MYYYPHSYYGQEAGTSVWTSPPTARPLLVFGSSGPAVVEWQQFLNSRGFHGEDGQPLELATTIFGKNTKFATESFQRSVGYTVGAGVDGKVGEDTWGAADKVLQGLGGTISPTPTPETTPDPGTLPTKPGAVPGTPAASHPGTGLIGPRGPAPEQGAFFNTTTIIVGVVALSALGTLLVLTRQQPGQRYT